MMKKGGLPRSPMVQNRELERIRQVLDMGEPLTALFNESHRRLIAEAAQVLGKDYDGLLEFLANEVGSVPGFETANPEQVLQAGASRMTELSVAVDKARKRSGETGSNTGQSPVDAGAQVGDVPAASNPMASTRNHGGLVARLEQLKEQLRSAVAAVSTVNHEDVGALQAALEQLCLACEDLKHQWRGNAAAEGDSKLSWMPLYNAEVASATAAMSRINASLNKRHNLRKLEAASLAANRSLADVDQVLHKATSMRPQSFTLNWWSGGKNSPPLPLRLTSRRMRSRWRDWTALSASWQLRRGVQSTKTSAAAPSHRRRTSHRHRLCGRRLFSFPQWTNKVTTSPTRLWLTCCRCWPRDNLNLLPLDGLSSPTATEAIIRLEKTWRRTCKIMAMVSATEP
jgi:hypothetical protein